MKDLDNNFEKDPSTIEKLGPLIWLLFIIFFIWLISYPLLDYFYPALNSKGTFGDSFGAINSLFSGLALAGIIYTILLQRKELALQRQEIRDNRRELARSATAQENSERSLKRQAENLKVTARLNALSTLISHYNQPRETKTAQHLSKNSTLKYIAEIEKILNKKSIN